MRLLPVVFISALAVWAQDPAAPKEQAPRKPQTPAAAKAGGKATPKAMDTYKPMVIPADATPDADGDYHYTDAQGKKWTYRRTPFGVLRMEDTPERTAAKAAAVSGAGIKATEDGDMVRFERQGPFGIWKWEKKKSELDATEKAALKNSQADNQTVSKQD